ncbi:hypothetical protein BDD12DRAFT_143092 [Trichophaea hybrida]|nr:hypothetical protein BDD12DRAFT_143092 [Trichophaea hybrida]
MKLSLVFTAVFVAFTSAAILPRAVPLTKQYFKLKVADNAPKEVAGQYININVGGGSLGIFPRGGEFQGYIKGTSTKRGAIISAKDEKAKVFLRPTHGTPQYFVRLGDPNSDPAPALISWKDFTVSRSASKKVKYWLDYNAPSDKVGSTSKNWVACGGKSGWSLYYGSPQTGCTAGFQLQVIYAVAK